MIAHLPLPLRLALSWVGVLPLRAVDDDMLVESHDVRGKEDATLYGRKGKSSVGVCSARTAFGVQKKLNSVTGLADLATFDRSHVHILPPEREKSYTPTRLTIIRQMLANMDLADRAHAMRSSCYSATRLKFAFVYDPQTTQQCWANHAEV